MASGISATAHTTSPPAADVITCHTIITTTTAANWTNAAGTTDTSLIARCPAEVGRPVRGMVCHA